MSIVKLNNNALTSVTALPSGVGSDPNVKTDLARLGLRVFANQNLVATNSDSLSYDVFQDSTAITNLTNAIRNDGEYMYAGTLTNVDTQIGGRDTNTFTFRFRFTTVDKKC